MRPAGAARILASLLLAGCAAPPTPRHDEVRERIAERVGARPIWDRGGPEARLIEETVRELLAGPLDLDRALKIALIHEPGLQAEYAALGIAEADLAQASTLANPRLAIGVPLGTTAGAWPLAQGAFAWSLASWLTRSARTSIATERREAVELALVDTIVARAAAVKLAFVAYQAACAREALDEARAALVTDDDANGVGGRRDLTSPPVADEAGELASLRSQAAKEEETLVRETSAEAVAEARERLSRLLGLWGAQLGWRVEAPLQGVPAMELPLEGLETRAIGARADLEAAKRRTAAIAQALRAAGDFAWLGDLDVGAGLRIEEGGGAYVGPTLGVTLPLFDRGEATIARLRSELLRERSEVTRIAIAIRSEVRRLRERLVGARRRVRHLREVVLPLLERAAERGGHVEDRRGAIAVRRRVVDAQEDYWTARYELERVVGGKLP